MGMFDTFVASDGSGREGQVKCFGCNLDMFQVGHKVGPLEAFETYSIAMREGGYVNVYECYYQDWTLTYRYPAIFDKWGRPFDPDIHDTVDPNDRADYDDPYFFSDLTKLENLPIFGEP